MHKHTIHFFCRNDITSIVHSYKTKLKNSLIVQ